MNGRALGGVPEVSVPKPLTFSKRPQLASLDSLIMVVAPVRRAAKFLSRHHSGRPDARSQTRDPRFADWLAQSRRRTCSRSESAASLPRPSVPSADVRMDKTRDAV